MKKLYILFGLVTMHINKENVIIVSGICTEYFIGGFRDSCRMKASPPELYYKPVICYWVW